MEHENRFESKETFFSTLSKYHLRTKNFGTKIVDAFPYGGDGGVPLAWREEDRTVFIDASDNHTLIIGSTGSKKSRLLVMPTVKILGYAGESMIITDPKAEIFERTAVELANNGYKILVINLRDPSASDNWNPLKIPYDFYCAGDQDRAYEFANDVATNLVLSEPGHTKEPYWDNSAKDLLFGLTLLLFRICKENNWPDAVNIDSLMMMRRKMFADDDITWYSGYASKQIGEYIKSNAVIDASLIGTINNAPNTRRNIICQLDHHLSPFVLSDKLTQMLSRNNINLDLLGQEKTAVFLIMPDEKTTYHKVVSLFIKQSYEHMIYCAQSLPNKTMPIRINYVLDEFSSLPKIKDFPSMISAARSRNIRFNLIMQSKNQFQRHYSSEAETIQANCSNWLFITSRELDLLEHISDLCGKRTGTDKPLISVSELQRFNKEKGEIMILHGRKRPFKGFLPDIDKYDDVKFALPDYPCNPTFYENDSKKMLEDKLRVLMTNSASSSISSNDNEKVLPPIDDVWM